MKRWIAGFATAVLICLVGTMGASARTLRTDTNPGNNWVSQPTSAWAIDLGSLPPGLLITAPGSTTPVAPTALTGTLAPSFIFTSVSPGVSLLAATDLGCQYDAQTYPDALSSSGLRPTDQVPNCSVLLTPNCSSPNTSTDYFACNPVAGAVDLEWWPNPSTNPTSPFFQIIYFDLGPAALRNSSGYDSTLYDSTYSAITPTGTGTPQDAWEVEFNCPFSGCATGAALQFDGVIYTTNTTNLSSASVTVTTPNGPGTIYSPQSSSSLLNEFVFDGYTLHAPPGWTAQNLTTTTLSASPTSVQTGQKVTFTATVTGKTPTPTGTVEFDSQGQSLGTATLSNGTAQFAATFPTTGTYTVTAIYKGDPGNVTSQSTAQTITVTLPPPAPTVTVTVAPNTITLGQTATLTWSSTNVTTCVATGSWTGTQAMQGTASETPTEAGSDTYTLSCTGAGETVAATTTLTVNAPAATVSISVSPTSITAGQSATLSWSSANATACSASGAWSGSQAASGSEAVAPAATMTYTLTCTGAGASGNASATLTVSAAPAQSGSSTGGGGTIGVWELIGLGLIGLGTRRRTQSHRPISPTC